MSRVAYAVSIRPLGWSEGMKACGATIHTPSEERAKDLVAEAPQLRSYVAVEWADLPAVARDNMERAERERA